MGDEKMLQKFWVEIEETLTRQLVVNAESADEAIRKIKEIYYAGSIVLTGDDCMGVVFSAEAQKAENFAKR